MLRDVVPATRALLHPGDVGEAPGSGGVLCSAGGGRHCPAGLDSQSGDGLRGALYCLVKSSRKKVPAAKGQHGLPFPSHGEVTSL